MLSGSVPSRHLLGCSGLLPGVSPAFDHTETILGEIFSPLARLPELSLGALPPREHALGFGAITASSWRCSALRPGVSPVFDRTENYSGEIFSPLARLPELSLGRLPPRELALGFGTITASSWHCSGLLPGVSPVFDRAETILRAILSPLARSQSCLWERFPPESTLSGSVPSRHLFRAVAVYYGGFPQYSIVQETILGKSFPHSPGSQSCLWERSPPRARSRVRYHHGIFLALQRSTTGGLPSNRSYINCSGRNLFPTRQAPRAVSGSASPPRACSRVRYHHGIFLAL